MFLKRPSNVYRRIKNNSNNAYYYKRNKYFRILAVDYTVCASGDQPFGFI